MAISCLSISLRCSRFLLRHSYARTQGEEAVALTRQYELSLRRGESVSALRTFKLLDPQHFSPRYLPSHPHRRAKSVPLGSDREPEPCWGSAEASPVARWSVPRAVLNPAALFCPAAAIGRSKMAAESRPATGRLRHERQGNGPTAIELLPAKLDHGQNAGVAR